MNHDAPRFAPLRPGERVRARLGSRHSARITITL
jgi:hypothetical protein